MRLGALETERLDHHSERLDLDKCEIVRGALFDRLNLLDEREAFERKEKAARKSGVAKVGSLPGGQGSNGMPIRFAPTQDAPTKDAALADEKIANKLERSFRRFCDFVDGAEGAIDRSIRIQTVLDDLKERAPLADAELAFAKFQEQLKAREGLRPKPIERLPDDVIVSGDVD